MDLAGADDNLRVFRAKFRGIKILPIAAEQGEGLDALKKLLAELVNE